MGRLDRWGNHDLRRAEHVVTAFRTQPPRTHMVHSRTARGVRRFLEQRADTFSSAWLATLAIAVGVMLGANAASDVLLTIAGGLPFLLAIGCAWVLRPSKRTVKASAFALTSVLAAIVSGALVRAFMHHENVISASDPKKTLLATADTVGTNFKLWWQSIALLGNGNFFGQTIGFSTALALSCAAMTLAAILIIPRIAQDELAQALDARRRDPPEPGQSERLAWCVFWASSLVLLSVAFIVSGITEDGSSRYLVGAIYATAALVPLLGSRGPIIRAAVTAGATLYAFTGWLALDHHKIDTPPSPSYQLASAVARIASQEHLSVGYAGYWDAAPITWRRTCVSRSSRWMTATATSICAPLNSI